jgi:hypothetical protein
MATETPLPPWKQKCQDLCIEMGKEGKAVVIIVYNPADKMQESCQNFPDTAGIIQMLQSELEYLRQRTSN